MKSLQQTILESSQINESKFDDAAKAIDKWLDVDISTTGEINGYVEAGKFSKVADMYMKHANKNALEKFKIDVSNKSDMKKLVDAVLVMYN